MAPSLTEPESASTNGHIAGVNGNGIHHNGTSSSKTTNGEPSVTTVKNAPSTTIPKFDLPKELPPTSAPTGIPTLSLFDLTGKTALVTGANGGIGGGMARGLAEAGADIIIFQIPGDVSKFSGQLAAETGRKVATYDCDLSSSAEIRKAVQKVLDDEHQIDILCNVAGISSGSIPILFETDEHKDAVRNSAQPHRLFDTKTNSSSPFLRSCKSTSTQSGFCHNAWGDT